MKNFAEWRIHIHRNMSSMMPCWTWQDSNRFASEQWQLYWSGVRDVRLADVSIWLISKYGYTTASRAKEMAKYVE